MKNKFFIILTSFIGILPALILLKIFSPWFFLPSINGGDWPYFAKGMFDAFHPIAPLWMTQSFGTGVINANFPLYWYLNFTAGFFVNTLHFPWEIVYKIFWFWLSFVLGSTGIIYLYTKVKKGSDLWEKSLSMLLYIGNSYFLMISSGGQMGIVLAYATAPWVVGNIIEGVGKIKDSKWKRIFKTGLIFGLFLSLQFLFDSRITFLTLGICIFYSIFRYIFATRLGLRGISLWQMLVYLFVGIFVLGQIHAFWLIPFLFFHLLSLPPGTTSSSGFIFFSFADFSHSLSLLHPNWPENIFGKVYFLQPEFLIYPIIAFIGILHIKKLENNIKSFYLFFWSN